MNVDLWIASRDESGKRVAYHIRNVQGDMIIEVVTKARWEDGVQIVTPTGRQKVTIDMTAEGDAGVVIEGLPIGELQEVGICEVHP